MNAGSSSLKVTLFGADDTLRRLASVTVERVGLNDSVQSADVPDFETALRLALERIEAHVRFELLAVGAQRMRSSFGDTGSTSILFATSVTPLARLVAISAAAFRVSW